MDQIKGIDLNQIMTVLQESGFSEAEINDHFDQIVEAIMAITIEEYLSRIPQEDQEAIMQTDSFENEEGLKQIASRFGAHYEQHAAEYPLNLDKATFGLRIRNYLQKNAKYI